MAQKCYNVRDMRYYGISILLSGLVVGVANGDSFLTAQSFPKTFNDLSFTDRMAVLAEGYEPFESEFEPGPNGALVCVKGCPYQGITIQDYDDFVRKNTEQALADAGAHQSGITSKIDSFLARKNGKCIAKHPDIPATQDIPWGEPVIGKPKISSPYGGRFHPIKHKQHIHTGIDYAVPTGTYVYTTANGTVEKVWHDPDCGNGLKIKYATGLSAIFCHLDYSLVNAGDIVYAGCAVAVSDNSGASMGPHLHYGMKDKNDNFIDPSSFTKRAK